MNRIRELRKEQGISMKEAARQLNLPYTTYANYEKGAREPSAETLITLAAFYRTTIDYLLGNSSHRDPPLPENIPNILPLPEMKSIPLLGEIACGEPILAQENIENYVSLPARLNADFALRCKGDSMINARIFDGDIVYIRQQPVIEDGETAAALIDDDATLKRVKLYEDHISLEPENPQYRPIVKWGPEMETVRILGKAVAFISAVR